MSEKRSWDIQPKRKAAPPAAARPVEQRRSAATPRPPRAVSEPRNRRVAPQPAITTVRPAPRTTHVPQGREREPLKARRRRARRRSLSVFFISIVLVLAAALGSLWFPQVRIQNIQTGGQDSSALQAIASSVMQGTYHYILPRNSIFFFPENEIRTQILAQYPDISAVSISRVSFNTIAVIGIPREAALTWCGPIYDSAPAVTQANASSTTSAPPIPTCYSADAQGIIFAPISQEAASSSDALKIYGPLAGGSVDQPLGATIGQASAIPNALQFVKAIKSLGVPIVSLVIRGDEADLYAQSGTRITYVLGREEIAVQLAESTFPSLNLNDGSLEYVDLRFEGKVYYKKVGAAASTQASSTPAH